MLSWTCTSLLCLTGGRQGDSPRLAGMAECCCGRWTQMTGSRLCTEKEIEEDLHKL